MVRRRLVRVSLWLGCVLVALPVQAEIFAVSGRQAGDPPVLTSVGPEGIRAEVAVSLANGFPIWYQDQNNGNKFQLCLDTALEVAPGVVINPCEYEPPLATAPPSFPANFGAEAIYWSAVALGSYTSSNAAPNVPPNAVLLVLGLQAAGANEAALADGTQAVFSRIRLRLDLPVAGTYRVTHPYGTRDYDVTIPGVRAINQTQDFGLLDIPGVLSVAQNFLAAMPDGLAAPAEPLPFDPALDAGIVNADGLNIGPFLVPAAAHGGVFNPADPATFAGGPITVGGRSYIGLPFAPPLAAAPLLPVTVEQPVVGSPLTPPNGGNFLRIELLNPAPGFFLNAADNSQVVQIDNFLLIGKLFNDGPNLAPVANNDVAATAKNRSTSIKVVVNDLDPVDGTNVHGLNVQAIAVAEPPGADPLAGGPMLNPLTGMPMITAPQATTAGGTVRRTINIATGEASFLYNPPIDFIGIDSFRYVVQDQGGLISAPATVTITVEDLQVGRADFRLRTGTWKLSGNSSDQSDNRVTLTTGPRTRLTPEATVATPAVTSAARGSVALRLSDSTIDFALDFDTLPASTITAAHIHVGAPGANGPVIFSLFQSGLDGPLTGSRRGTLQTFHLQTRPAAGVSSFGEALNAILSGNAYVDVHTTAFPNGEMRGQFTRPTLGSAEVTASGWEFRGHSPVSLGALPSVIVESANGIQVIGIPLRLR